MADTEFSYGKSILFPGTQHVDPDHQPPTQTEDVDMEFSQSLLFPQQNHDATPISVASSEPRNASGITADGKSKSVKLLDGSVVVLKPRYRRPISLNLSEDSDTILNMDKLYERVERRKKLRENQEQVRKRKEQKQSSAIVPQAHLWSEKYKPKSFFQICSAGNDRQYRQILHWLNKWDAMVFGHAKVESDSTDNLGRPLRKILLVHGPPGIGKTTVVHLLAKIHGYAIEELNAANSMNALLGAEASEGAGRFANATAALKLKIKNALTMNSITSNGKPTCLVIDEVDSAANTSDIVKVISELVRADQINNRKREGQDFQKEHRKKPSKKPFSLNRPIICIANDIYNTTSRPGGPNPMETLRPLCEMVSFRKPSAGANKGAKVSKSAQTTVKDLLMEISKSEKLGLDRKEVAEVFEICDGDIRACINYLQFSSRKLDTDIPSFEAERSVSSLNKDSSVTWFSLVDLIFTRNQNISKEESFEEMLDLVSSGEGRSAASGSLDKVIRGCFNKYLDVVHLQDDTAVRPAEISDWLFYYDLLTTQNSNTHFYPTLTTLKFWSLFSDINPQKFRDMDGLIPDARNLEFNSREVLKQNKSTVRKLVDSIPLKSKGSFCGTSFNNAFYSCEFIPFLDKMLSPETGSGKSKQSLKIHEAKVVERLADLVKMLDIKLESQKDVDTNQVYLLYGPDWEGITMFEAGEQALDQKKRLLNIKRQWLFPLLKSEIDSFTATGLLKRHNAELQDQEKPDTTQKRAKMTSSLEFFKGQYDDISTKIATAAKPVNREATRIWVKHHEGFSNAVRKNIGWYELWN